jgi:hypothetical protein
VQRPFRYLLDPVFLAAVAIYVGNRFAIRPLIGAPGDFCHSYLSDLVCVPFLLPPMLRLERALGIRGHDAPPTVRELTLMVVVWSLVFELVVPTTPLGTWFPNAVGDPVDVLMYAAGAVVAGALWRSRTTPAPLVPPPGGAYAQHLLVACISGKAWVGTLSSLAVSLVVAAVVLAAQNIPPGVH